MKALMIPLVLTMAGGLASANEMPKASHKHSATAESKAPSTKVQGEVVSTDASANKLVLKTSSGEETLMVTGKAAARLKDLTAGEKVTVKERNNQVYSISTGKAKGKHHASKAANTAPAASRKY